MHTKSTHTPRPCWVQQSCHFFSPSAPFSWSICKHPNENIVSIEGYCKQLFSKYFLEIIEREKERELVCAHQGPHFDKSPLASFDTHTHTWHHVLEVTTLIYTPDSPGVKDHLEWYPPGRWQVELADAGFDPWLPTCEITVEIMRYNPTRNCQLYHKPHVILLNASSPIERRFLLYFRTVFNIGFSSC